ncbi:MAG: biopolymer transporter ExbD [Gammaproteobacteria bacterium]|jgi:biopolymer transport protein ExbD|nr:biopolymer transporter ExbD [Gammaproteobacteria bacterium]
MHLKYEKKEYHFETLLPLVNIVFLLLIFFLLAGSFQTPEPLEVSSPQASTSIEEAREVATFFLSADGQYAYQDSTISKQQLLVLAAQLEPIQGNKVMRLKADAAADAAAVIVLLDELAQLEITEVRIVTLANDE